MTVEYSYLVKLNPLLQKKSREEVQALIECMEDCGYVWDRANKLFANSKLGLSVRTQGLDILTPECFRSHYEKVLAEYNENPDQYYLRAKASEIYSRWAPRIFVMLVVDLVVGWAISPMSYWIWSLVAIILLLVLMKSFFIDAQKATVKS